MRGERESKSNGGSWNLALALSTLIAACSSNEPAETPPDFDSLMGERRYRAALVWVDERLAREPGDRALLDSKVRVLRELGLERQALAALQEMRKAYPDDARVAYETGEVAARLGDAGAARAEFAAARALAPDDWRPAVAEAALLLADDPPGLDAADALLAPWLEGPGARVEARFHRGLVLEARGEAAVARVAYERGLELEPGHVPSLANAARLAESAGDFDGALVLLRRARAAAAAPVPVPTPDEALLRELDRRIEKLTTPHDR